jgi:hypothetical protein
VEFKTMQIVPIVCALCTTIPALVALWGFYGAFARGLNTTHQQGGAIALGYFGFMLALFLIPIMLANARDPRHHQLGEDAGKAFAKAFLMLLLCIPAVFVVIGIFMPPFILLGAWAWFLFRVWVAMRAPGAQVPDVLTATTAQPPSGTVPRAESPANRR